MEFKKTLEGLKCVSCKEYDLAILNFSSISSDSENQFTKEQISFFENLDDIFTQNRVDTPTRWSFICFLSRFGIFKGKEATKASDFQIDSAINEFEKISKKDRLLKNLKLFLFGQTLEIPKICTDKLALELSREILYVASNHNSLYRTLQLLFKPLISEITDIRVFRLLGYSAFQLYTPAPPKEFWNIRLLTTNEQYRDIIYYSQDLSFLQKLQQDYIDTFQYPSDFPGSLTFNSSSCSLLMTSINKNVHFVDLLSQLIRDKIHKLEIGSIPQIARTVPSFVPFLFAAYQPFLYLSPQIFLRLITAKLPSVNNSENNYCYKNNNLSENIIDLQQRFINDLLFTKLIVDLNNENFNKFEKDDQNSKKTEKKKSFFSKKKKTEEPPNKSAKPKVRRDSDLGLFIRDFGCPVNEILKDHSIPFLLNGHFKRPEFIEFEKKKFYIFSDEESQHDFDFIHAFNSISETIELFVTTQNKTHNMIPIQRSLLSSIENNIQLIHDQNLLQKVAIDIFSLLFIKENKSDNSGFLCKNISVAYLVLKILKKYFNNDRFIKFGALLLSHTSLRMPKRQIYGISTVLTSNLNFLLNFITKQDWNNAYEIVLLLSGNQKSNLDHQSQIYWRAYILSLAVTMLISGKSCNIECEQFKEELNLEISVSSSIYNTDDCIDYVQSVVDKQPSSKEKEDKLALISDISKIRESRKKTELEDIFSPLKDSYWIDVEPAIVNLEMFPFDFFTNKLIERYEIPLKKSKSLYNFVNFIDLYYKCTHSSKNDPFSLSPIQAISNAFNNGKIELAEQMASTLNIDLFEFAMRTQSQFIFNTSFIDHFGSKHPLECIEIFYRLINKTLIQFDPENLTKSIKSNEKVEKIINYLNKDKIIDSNNTLEEPIEFEFIELIKSSKQSNQNLYKEFDDYLYKLNHSRISQIVISNFDKIDKDVAIYLLNIVGYTIDMNSVNENIKRLFLSNEIDKFVSIEIDQKDQIIERLIENNLFELAYKYISLNSQSQDERDEIIISIVSKLLDSKASLNQFISLFEDSIYLYELIATKFQDKISVLIERCPLSIKPILAAFSSLPDSIRTVSSLFDRSTITKAICSQIRDDKNDEIVFQLNKEQMILFDDESLCLIHKEIVDHSNCIEKFIEMTTHFCSLVETSRQTIFTRANSLFIQKELGLINIDSLEKEFDTFILINRLTRFNRLFKLEENVSIVLKAYRLLLIESPFYFINESYSINPEKKNQSNLFKALLKLDLDPIAFMLPKELFDTFNYTKEKVQIMLKLGRFDDALHILNVNKQYVYEMDELFLCPFLYKQFYHSNLLPLICNLCSNVDRFFSQIKSSLNSDSDFSDALNSNLSNLLNYKEFVSYCKIKISSFPLLSFCSDFCERFSTKDSFFRFCIRRGAMTTVVNKFMQIDDNEINNNCQNIFINSIVECSIEFDKFQLLKKEMNDYLKSNNKSSISSYWKHLVDFCQSHEMGFLMLEVSEILSLKDKKALSYIDIFGEIEPKNVQKKIDCLEKVRTVLNELIKDQQQQSNASTKLRKNRSGSLKTIPDLDEANEPSLSQQSSSILFDPDEFNSRSPDEFCEYDICSSFDEEDNNTAKKGARSNSNAKKNKIHLGFSELLLIANLLNEFLSFFVEKNEPFPDSMNLFNGSLASLALGGFFLRNGRFDLLQRISDVMKVPQKVIVKNFFEFITKSKCYELNHASTRKKQIDSETNEVSILSRNDGIAANSIKTEDENTNSNNENENTNSNNENENTNSNNENENTNSNNENENTNSNNEDEKADENVTENADSNNENTNSNNENENTNSNNVAENVDENVTENADSNNESTNSNNVAEKTEENVTENADSNNVTERTNTSEDANEEILVDDNQKMSSNHVENEALNKDAANEGNLNTNEAKGQARQDHDNLSLNSDKSEIVQFVEETKSKENFWNNNDFYYVHLYASKLSFSQNSRLIPVVLDKLLPQEKLPEMLLEFDFLNEAFKTLKEKNVASELIPAIATRASILGDCEMVKKCEDELGIKKEDIVEIDINE